MKSQGCFDGICQSRSKRRLTSTKVNQYEDCNYCFSVLNLLFIIRIFPKVDRREESVQSKTVTIALVC